MTRRGRGEIKKIGDLFAVYKNRLRAPQGAVTKAFVSVIQEEFNYQVPTTACSYNVHTRVLHVRVTGPLKSEIIFRKKKILTILKTTLGEKGYPTEIL